MLHWFHICNACGNKYDKNEKLPRFGLSPLFEYFDYVCPKCKSTNWTYTNNEEEEKKKKH